MDSEDRFLAFMIVSEVVITAIAFIGAYYIFKPLLSGKKEQEDKKELDQEINHESDVKGDS